MLVHHRSSRRRTGHSLVELLVCVVIIALLSAISLTYYQGAIDQQDLKIAAPAVTGIVEGFRREAAEYGSNITVAFELSTSTMRVSKRKGSQVQEDTIDIKDRGLLKRNHRFRRYAWPDGAEEPASFTFVGGAKPDGGTVFFGTALAEAKIRIAGTHVICELN